MNQTETKPAPAEITVSPARRRFPPRCERCGDIPHPHRKCEQYMLDNQRPGPKE